MGPRLVRFLYVMDGTLHPLQIAVEVLPQCNGIGRGVSGKELGLDVVISVGSHDEISVLRRTERKTGALSLCHMSNKVTI